MKIEELTVPRINILEMFNSVADITWTAQGHQNRGYFKLDNVTYAIHIDEYDAPLPSKTLTIVDVGFSVEQIDGTNMDSSQKPTNLNSHTSKILGVVLNGVTDKLKTMQYDVILLGAHDKNHKVRTRMQIYSTMANRYAKVEGLYISNANTTNGKYILLTKELLSQQDKDVVQQYTAQK